MCQVIRFILFAVLISGDLFGQEAKFIEGVVKDTIGNPLGFSTITVQNDRKTEIVSYTITDSNGCYKILVTKKSDSLSIKANSFGYEAEIIPVPVSNLPGNRLIRIDFILKSMVTQLKEVVVRTNSFKIIIVNDTVTFKADSFRNNTEKVTEDLLKKIPGIEVGKDGSISVNGKRIEKILIEGDGLFNSNYRILTRNMSADLVDKIQIINKYTDNPLLKGIINSDDKALNITLKNSPEKTLFGNGAFGLGNDNRYEISANLISFLKKTKFFVFTNANSIGKDPLPEVANNSELEESFNNQEANETISNNLIELIRFSPRDFTRDRINFNQAKLGSFSVITKSNKKLTITGLVYAFADRAMLNQQNNYRYFINGSPISIYEINHYKQSPFLIKGYVNLVYKPKQTVEMDYTFNSGYGRLLTNATMLSDNASLINKGDDQNLQFNHKASYTNRISERKVFLVDGYFTAIMKSQKFDLSQSPPGNLPFVNLYYQNLFQSISYPLSVARISARYITGNNINNISVESGIHYKNQRLVSSLDTMSAFRDIKLVSDIFKNNLRSRQLNGYTRIACTKKISATLKLTTQFSANFQENDLMNSAQRITRSTESFFRIVPKIGIKWAKSNHIVSAGYSYNTRLPELTDLTSGYILSDYRTLQKGTDLYRLSNIRIARVSYTYANWSKQVIIYFNFIHLVDKGVLNRQYELSKSYDIIHLIPLISTQRNSIYSFGLDKFIPSISSSIKIKVNATNNRYQNQLNDVSKREVVSLGTNTAISLRSAWKGYFNWGVGSAYNYSMDKVSEGNQNSSFDNTIITSYLNLSLKMSKVIIAEINGEHYYFNAIHSGKKSYLFVDFSFHYGMQQNKISFSLVGSNLVNNKVFINSSINDYSTQMQQYRLLPAYCMFEMNYRF